MLARNMCTEEYRPAATLNYVVRYLYKIGKLNEHSPFTVDQTLNRVYSGFKILSEPY